MEGLGKVYSEWGGLIPLSDENILKQAEGWDVNVRSPWRRILPKSVFAGYGGDVISTLYITNKRIVLVREIDVWSQVKEDLTPLGLPAAASKEARLKKLKASGARQYCEVWRMNLRVVRMRKRERPLSWLDLRLLGDDGKQYAVTLWKTKGLDSETLSLVESQFRQRNR